ncbi:MAG: glycosyltransferase, partial [Thermincolia bacterium]
FYTACDCYVHPYRSEGYGLPIAEAMACGLPVIVTGEGACRDFCHEGNAYLIPATEVRSQEKGVSGIETVDYPAWLKPDKGYLRRLMRHVFENREEARAKGLAAHQEITANHTWEKTTEAIVERFKVLITKPYTTKFKPQRLSLCMIVKNEEKNLARCLESVTGFVDEIVIVDTGSTDGTVEIAKGYGAKVIDFPWTGDFSAARNLSLENASGDWIIYLDADEELVSADGPKLRAMLNRNDIEGFYLSETNFIGEQEGEDAVISAAFRVFRNQPQYRFTGAIHEQIYGLIKDLGGNIENTNIRINHYGYLQNANKDKDKINRNLQILKGEVKRNPTYSFGRFNLGVEYMRLADYGKALAEFQVAFKYLNNLNMQFASALLYDICFCLKNLKRYKEALNVLEDTIKAYPDYTDLYYMRAWINMETQNYQGAIYDFNQCLQMGTSGNQYQAQMGVGDFKAWIGQGQAYEKFGELAKAVNCYTNALKINKKALLALVHLGALLIPREPVEQVKKYLEDLVDLQNPDTLIVLSQIFNEGKHFAVALEYITKVLEIKSSDTAFNLKGGYLTNLKRYSEAMDCFTQVGAESKYYPQATVNKAFCAMLLDEYPLAEKILVNLVQYSDYSASAITYQALIKGFQGISDNIEPLRKNQETVLATLWDITEKLLQLEEYNKFENCINLIAIVESKQLALKLGKLYYRYGYIDSAVEDLLKSFDEQVYDDELFTILGEICYTRELYEDAENFYRQALAIEPKKLKTYLELNKVLSNQQKYKEAVEILRLGLRHFPESELLRATIRTVGLAANL